MSITWLLRFPPSWCLVRNDYKSDDDDVLERAKVPNKCPVRYGIIRCC